MRFVQNFRLAIKCIQSILGDYIERGFDLTSSPYETWNVDFPLGLIQIQLRSVREVL